MASGSFRTPTYNGSAKTRKYIQVTWSSTNDVNNNQSTINWHAYSYGDSGWVYGGPIVVTINGVSTTVVSGSNRIQLYNGTSLGSGSTTVTHDADGTKTVNVSIQANIYVGASSPPNVTYSGTITMTANPVYTLAISEGNGSSITVNRTSCAGYGSAGDLTAGVNKLCKDDILKITFGSDPNYAIDAHTVNGATFTSGNAHTVSGGVTVVSTARALASQIGATDANVGSTSTVTITKYNNVHSHSVQYSFNGLSGYITSSGGTSNTEVKFTDTSVAFTIPTFFYSVLSNAQSGTCTLTCKTYESVSSSTVVGDVSTCTFTVSVSSGTNSPTVVGTVTDIDPVTTSLTGDSSVLIRYKSKARCAITATPQNYATIAAKYINDSEISGNYIDYENVSTASFTFKALDSRGYIGTATTTPTMIQYVPLTCNPILSRPTPTGNVITISLTGKVFRGSFGAYSNTLSIQYRYRKTSEVTYGAWVTLPLSGNISYGASSYETPAPINLTGNFDYTESYVFQIQATDGTSNIVLSTVTQTVSVAKGLPVFDWGEDDFNINGTFKINGVPVSFGGGKTIKYINQTVTTEYGDYLGDVNADSVHNNSDVTLMARYIAGTSTPGTHAAAAADINGDGVITQADLNILNWFITCGLDMSEYTLARYDVTYEDNTTGQFYGGVLKSMINSSGSGQSGGYYVPSVSADGTLTWTASQSGMPSVSSSNIKGSQGAPGTNGGRWYTGVNIYGTSTSNTIFPGSGIANAVVGDMYLHTSAYNIYRCNVGGMSQVAEWAYVGNILGAPGSTPNLTIGTVSTLAAGSNATASITGSAANPVLNLGIPQGASGTFVGNKMFYGSCSTSANVSNKEATCGSGFTLEQGVMVNILFTTPQGYDTTNANPLTLSVNGTEAKNIVGVNPTKPPLNAWRAFEVVSFIYTGSVWEMIRGGIASTTYYGATKLSSATNSTSETEAATSRAVKEAYDLAATKTTASDVNTLIADYINNLDARGVSY